MDIVTLNDLTNNKAYTYASMLRKYKDKINEIISTLNQVIGELGSFDESISALEDEVDNLVPKSNLTQGDFISCLIKANHKGSFVFDELEQNVIYEVVNAKNHILLATIDVDNEDEIIVPMTYFVNNSEYQVISVKFITSFENNNIVFESVTDNVDLTTGDIFYIRKLIKLY